MANILIAEDSEETSRLIKFTLEKSGHQVRIAEDGITALKEIEENLPDLLVTDILMPGLSGFELMDEILRRGVKLKTIVLAVQKNDEDIIKGLGYGAIDFIQKPFSPRELLARVTRALER